MGRKIAALLVVIAFGFAGLGAIGTPVGAATGQAPVGAFDSVGLSFDPTARVSGWAADPSAPGQSVEIRLYVDGSYVGVTHTGLSRPDVARTLPWAGPKSGWRADVPLILNGLLCAYAINLGAGANTTLGCRRLGGYGPDAHSPIGAVDRVVVTPGLVRITGWAGDPDDRNRDRSVRVQLLLDYGSAIISLANRPRPDVRAVTGLNAMTGFDLTMAVMPGPHDFCVVAENTGVGVWFPTIGCSHRTVPGVQPPAAHEPHGSLETRGETFGTDNWYARGWAYDPDSAGPVTVLVRSFGYGIVDRPDVRATSRRLTTGDLRPDVQDGEPAAGPAAGFVGYLGTTDEGQLTYSCAYVTNLGPGKNRFIGCSQDRVVLDADFIAAYPWPGT
jgi:hypothetical protein